MIWSAKMVDSVDPPLLIETEKWFDARAYALQKIGEGVQVRAVKTSFKPDVELRWAGSDFNNSGDRQLWVRERGKKWVRA